MTTVLANAEPSTNVNILGVGCEAGQTTMRSYANDAAGAAQGVKREVDTVVRNQAEKILRDLDIVKREEFEAVKDMARLARELKGRACVDLDIDRQSIVPFGSRSEIRALIEEETRTLGSHRGGLSMICGIYPPTPPENVDALCCAMEEFRTYWADRR